MLVTVLRVRGSAPRSEGARLLTRDGVLLAGTIGGGHLEQRAIDEAAARLGVWRDVACGAASGAAAGATSGAATNATADTLTHHERFALGPALGQCCGGTVDLAWQLATLDHRGEAAIAGTSRSDADGSDADGRHGDGRHDDGSDGDTYLDTHVAGLHLRERRTPPWTVLIFGAGHVGRALTHVLAVLPWRVVLCDSRADQLRVSPLPLNCEAAHTEPVALLTAWGWPLNWGVPPYPTATNDLPASTPSASQRPKPAPAARTLALVMTHDHSLDRELVAALLPARDKAGAPLAFVGLIGSRSKIAGLRQRLDGRTSAADLARLVAPIGVRGSDGALVGGKTPAEIAIATAAQLVDVVSRHAAADG